MTWVRSDDQYPIHRKVAPLSDAAFRLDVEGIHWCARNLTDGRIAPDELGQVTKKTRPERYAAELVARGRWHTAGQQCPSAKCPPSGPEGWVIHDYWDYQPSREKALREKEAKAERQRRWIESKKGNKDGSRDASHLPSQDASRDAARRDAAPRDANPAPPRPAPKEAGRGDPPRATADRRQAADAAADGREDQNHADPPPVDWRTLPAAGVAREPDDADRARRGAAAVRANIRRPPAPVRVNALDVLRKLTDPPAEQLAQPDDDGSDQP